MKKLLSIQVGPPKTLESPNFSGGLKTWITGIFKETVNAPVHLRFTNLDGDGQADLVNHGGVDKAVNVYPIEHYPYWRDKLNIPALTNGAFGENFTTSGLLETDICIGDTFTLGDAIVQVSQPRQPCWKLAIKWHIKDLALQVEQTGKTGWYFRVLQEGLVKADDELRLIEHPFPQWTIEAANQIMHHRPEDFEAAAKLADCPLLSASWQRSLSHRANSGKAADTSARHGN
ncbi:MAG TPA: MOSC domain-containing protein [Verrucomicrobiae bacterium]